MGILTENGCGSQYFVLSRFVQWQADRAKSIRFGDLCEDCAAWDAAVDLWLLAAPAEELVSTDALSHGGQRLGR